jgi:isopenicillin N synthase-like dioxygenase
MLFFFKQKEKTMKVKASFYPLSIVNYQSEFKNFSRKVYNFLKLYRCFFLTGLDEELLTIVDKLHHNYEQFQRFSKDRTKQVHGHPYKGNHKSDGYYPDRSYYTGSFVGNRFLVSRDAKGKLLRPELSTCKLTEKMCILEKHFSDHMDKITYLLLKGLQNELGIKDHLTNFLKGHKSTTNIHHYKIVDHKKLLELHHDKKLTVTDDEQLILFQPHKDFSALTFIFYKKNNCMGLEGQYNNQFLPIKLPNKPGMLVLTGRAMEILTANHLKALEHRVVDIENVNLSNRKLITKFILARKKLKSAKQLKDKNSIDIEDWDEYVTKNMKDYKNNMTNEEKYSTLDKLLERKFPNRNKFFYHIKKSSGNVQNTPPMPRIFCKL